MSQPHKIKKSLSFRNRKRLSKVYVHFDEEDSIGLVTYTLNRDSLHMIKNVTVGFSKETFETIMGIYLREIHG